MESAKPLGDGSPSPRRLDALKTKAAGILVNMLLPLSDCLAGLLLCEAGLRLLHPPYARRGFLGQQDTGTRHLNPRHVFLRKAACPSICFHKTERGQ